MSGREFMHNCKDNFLRGMSIVGGRLWPILLVLLMATPATALPKQTIGWLEYVHIGDANLRLEAKIDTGADTTSVNARGIRAIKVGGEDWIRFKLDDTHGHSVTLERKLVRYVKIKQKSALSTKRPVIKLGICLGSIFQEVEVNLAMRRNFKYPMLIGRNYLKGVFVVDSGAEHTSGPSCPGVKGD